MLNNQKLGAKRIFILSGVSFVLSLCFVLAVVWYERRQSVTLGGDFTLNHLGQSWTLSQHAKKLNLVYVGYVKCPDVCPMTLSFASQGFKKLSEKELVKTQFIFISVDVEHDTPESVAVYATQFFPAFVGLTGTQASIDKTVASIGASYMVEKDPKSYLGYSVAHSDRVFILNKDAEVIDSISNLRSAEVLIQKIKEHL